MNDSTGQGAPQIKVLVAAGGTVGHLQPALLIAAELRDRNCTVTCACSDNGRDAQFVEAAGFAARTINITGIPRRGIYRQVAALFRAFRATLSSFVLLRKLRPDAVLCGGGFVGAPVAVAARFLGIPIITTEVDAHLGLANRVAARYSRHLCTTFPLPQYRSRQTVTGRPVSPKFAAADRGAARAELGIPESARVVVAVGGSGGALRLNTAVAGAFGYSDHLQVDEAELHVVHLSGARDYRAITDMLAETSGGGDPSVVDKQYHLIEYSNDMPTLFAAADLVISRAGGTIFEIAAAGRAALLVPSMNVTGDHQRLNAQHFAAHNAAVVVDDVDCTPEEIRETVLRLLSKGGDTERVALAGSIRKLARINAAADIATIVQKTTAPYQSSLTEPSAPALRNVANRLDAATRRMADATQLLGMVEPVTSSTSATASSDASRPVLSVVANDRDEREIYAGRVFHMMGIAGAGVSALAQVTQAWGGHVSGCDPTPSPYLVQVRGHGITTFDDHGAAHVVGATDLVVSSAVSKNHPEIVAARSAGARVWLRGELLGDMTQYRKTVVVAGAHGKSTTTAMIAHMARAAGSDPTVIIGAQVPTLGGNNVHMGEGEWLIVEGDESDRTLLDLHADIAVVTNIERDHHHTFSSDEEVDELFHNWMQSQSPSTPLVAGDTSVRRMLPETGANKDGAATRPFVLRDLSGHRAEAIRHVLPLPGEHNVSNALCAVAACELMGLDPEVCIQSLQSFSGVGRRFEIRHRSAGRAVIDDYAHHPTEVAATIAAAHQWISRESDLKRLVVIFQPHLYSRTRELAVDFRAALRAADRALVLPIYGAREAPEPGVTQRLIADGSDSHVIALDVDPVTGDVTTICEQVQWGDCIITMGAGTITQLGDKLVAALGEQQSGPPIRPDSSLPGWIERDVPLHKFTTIGTGGNADFHATVSTDDELQQTLAWAHAANLPTAVVGLGSNSLIADEGFRGVSIRLSGDLSRIEIDREAALVTCGGGASLAAIVRRCRDEGLSGIEFGCAIPGTVGGAVKMNAGAYGSEMVTVLRDARVVTATAQRTVTPDELDMQYRHTNIGPGEIVSEAVLHLTHDDPDAIKERVKEMQRKRTDSQPRAARSFGSVFRNPEGDRGAGALIEAAGLKGHVIGGACISPKHGNFIENTDNAKTADILALMKLAQQQVSGQFGIDLIPEVHLLDVDGYRPLHPQAGGVK